ncbi:amidase [Mycobacterium sp. M1]|uniref:amidase n=1 Tax=Mycolicibacter acidiphilus TaxID=2835306 RepID=A0ABS5RGH7_9MYCO|nr:amidase [Mycolicibacter acidiphilus]
MDRTDAVGLAELVSAGEISPAELLEAVARRIDERNSDLNAVVATRIEQARDEIAAGLPDGPLRGVPFAVKDLHCDVAGLPTTAGSRLFADAVAERDGVLVSRYRRAGLVIVGKTNAAELGLNASTEPALFGPTRNPWRLTHSPGGSSGGSAAAVAGGLLPAAHASDGGGSVRIPAACCGLLGLKPSRGRVPDDHGGSAFAYPLPAHHAVTRTVRDSAALLDAVAGPLPGDPYATLPAPEFGSFLAGVDREPGPLRVGTAIASADGVPAFPAGAAAVGRIAGVLTNLGHRVDEAAPQWDPVAASMAGAALMITQARVRIAERLAALGRELAADDIEPFSRFLLEELPAQSGADVYAALQTIEATGRQVAPFFADHDVWLTPTLQVPVPRLGVLDTADPMAVFAHSPALAAFTSFCNATGLPAVSVPAGFDDDGLPIGVQLVGRMGAEDTLLRVARQLERAVPWPWQAPADQFTRSRGTPVRNP